jgi:hypothetical protein
MGPLSEPEFPKTPENDFKKSGALAAAVLD